MTMDSDEFKKNLLWYGADLGQWPEAMRQAAMTALQNSSKLQALIAEQERFEGVLKRRKYEEPSDDLAQRIISASFQGNIKSSFSLRLFLSRLFADEFYFPGPALLVASTLMIAALVIGFVIGFSSSTRAVLSDPRQANLGEFLNYEGNALWAKE